MHKQERTDGICLSGSRLLISLSILSSSIYLPVNYMILFLFFFTDFIVYMYIFIIY